jgi:PPOX class probable F420-dependent enzyme
MRVDVRNDLEPSDLGDLLDLPLVAVLGTYRADGRMLLSPVWHRWRDGGFDVWTFPDDIKVRHLRRDPRASILVYDHTPPYRGIELRTEPTLHEGTRDAVREIAVRYLGPDAGEAYVSRTPNEIVIIRLQPGELRAWDFADQW